MDWHEIDQDLEMDLDEGVLRNFGAAVLFGRVVNLSSQIKRSKHVEEKLDLLASQNSTVAAIVMAALESSWRSQTARMKAGS